MAGAGWMFVDSDTSLGYVIHLWGILKRILIGTKVIQSPLVYSRNTMGVIQTNSKVTRAMSP